MSNAWTYMKENPKYFWPRKFRMLEPISYYESLPSGKYKALTFMESKLGDFQPESENFDFPIYSYFVGTAMQTIVENVRTELTKHLLNQLG